MCDIILSVKIGGNFMFIGREWELESLNALYNSGKFEFVVLYGRRRVGKTELIKRFIEGKNAVYFTGVESNARQNLENLSGSIIEYFSGLSKEGGISFSSFQEALETAFRLAEKDRLILAVDEYPYVARAYKSFASTLQMIIDRYKDRSKLMLILCGSSMSYMEDHVLAYKAPLYGRKTAQIKLLPFSFEETCRYLKNYSPLEKALAYGIMGGTPQYLMQMDDKRSIEENIKNTYLNPISSIYEEPTNLLKQEVREPAIYSAVITAIASGASRMSEISGKIGEDTNKCSTYIKSLLTLGIVRKEIPYGEKSSKKTIYSIDDNMFRFWYRFVPENTSLIARGAIDIVYKRIEPQLSDYMGKVFEEICKQYLWKQLLDGRSPVEFNSLGRWWGNDPVRKCQAEIDIMGREDKDTALFAECKWTNEKTDLSVLETLVGRGELFSYKKKYYFLFSKSGFTKGCAEKAKELGNVSLVTYGDIVKKSINVT